jgi:transposase
MTRIADDFDAIRRRLAELANKSEKLTTITPANSPTQSPPTRTCRSCGATQAYIVDHRCWVCPRCGASSAP